MNASEEYLQSCRQTVEKLAATQLPAINQAADVIAKSVIGGGIVYTFGTGHSHELAEEVA